MQWCATQRRLRYVAITLEVHLRKVILNRWAENKFQYSSAHCRRQEELVGLQQELDESHRLIDTLKSEIQLHEKLSLTQSEATGNCPPVNSGYFDISVLLFRRQRCLFCRSYPRPLNGPSLRCVPFFQIESDPVTSSTWASCFRRFARCALNWNGASTPTPLSDANSRSNSRGHRGVTTRSPQSTSITFRRDEPRRSEIRPIARRTAPGGSSNWILVNEKRIFL